LECGAFPPLLFLFWSAALFRRFCFFFGARRFSAAIFRLGACRLSCRFGMQRFLTARFYHAENFDASGGKEKKKKRKKRRKSAALQN